MLLSYLIQSTVYLLILSGTFKWTEERDRLFLREVLVVEPYLYKPGTKETGLKWSEVAEKINRYAHFSSKPRDQRSVRERFSKLLSDHKRKINAEEAATGTAPDPPTETEQILEDIIERMKTTPIPASAKDGKKEEKKRQDALNTRDKAMKTWRKAKSNGNDESGSESEGESEKEKPSVKRRKRRGGSDALQYLAEKTERETELRKQELELRREELHLQAEQQREQFKMQQEQFKFMADVLGKLSK